MKRTIIAAAAFAAVCCAHGQSITVARSQETTSKDLPFSYEAEKTVVEYDGVRMLGTVKNTGAAGFRYVKVTFTAIRSGQFVARDVIYADPNEIGPGQVGYVDGTIKTGGVVPDKIEWNVTGNPAR